MRPQLIGVGLLVWLGVAGELRGVVIGECDLVVLDCAGG